MSEWWSAFLDGAFVTGMFYTLLVWATVRHWERKNLKELKTETQLCSPQCTKTLNVRG